MCKTRKQNPFTVTFLALIAAAVILEMAAPARGAVVTPRIGGAGRMHDVAPMIMPEITFDGTNVVVKNMMGMPWTALTGAARPQMWPLQGEDTLAPGVWFNALDGMAWNWQYGWNGAGFDPMLLPAGGKVWLEVLNQSEGLNTYARSTTVYTAIFGTDGSSMRWMWPQMMAHNAYTVIPQYGEWEATYRVYIGNETTGDPMAGFGSTDVTLTWVSVPEPATLALLLTGIICAHRQKRSY